MIVRKQRCHHTLLILIMFGLLPISIMAGEIKPFVSGSLKKIQTAQSGSPFIISLWSIDCPPCYKEMETWRQLNQQHPDLKIILVATDDLEFQPDVLATTKQLRVDHFESWQFAEQNTDRLRFEIDKNWYGELPRTYLINAEGEATGVSGVIAYKTLEKWVESHSVSNQ